MIFILYGIFTAMTAGVERALIAEIAPGRLKGTMLGLHSTIAGSRYCQPVSSAAFYGSPLEAPFRLLSALPCLLLLQFY